MRKSLTFIAAMIWLAAAEAQNVGIGTNTPNTNAILDISSTNKAVLIPRLIDTSNVSNPTEGMMIFNKNSKAPFFHDGKQWLSLGARTPSAQPTAGATITYAVTSSLFPSGEFVASSGQVGLGVGISQPNPPSAASASEFTFTKPLDLNSNWFQLAIFKGQFITSVEFKYYASGSSVPYMSYRFRNVYFSGYSNSSGGDLPSEAISVSYRYYGFKDWVNNLEFGWDTASNSQSSY
jgi:hypothetical protein